MDLNCKIDCLDRQIGSINLDRDQDTNVYRRNDETVYCEILNAALKIA